MYSFLPLLQLFGRLHYLLYYYRLVHPASPLALIIVNEGNDCENAVIVAFTVHPTHAGGQSVLLLKRFALECETRARGLPHGGHPAWGKKKNNMGPNTCKCSTPVQPCVTFVHAHGKRIALSLNGGTLLRMFV